MAAWTLVRTRLRTPAWAIVSVLFLAGCAATPLTPPPGTPTSPTAPAASATPTAPTASATTPTATPTPTGTVSPLGCPASTGASVRQAPGTGKTVALTFDDGPGPQTLELAAVLAKAGVHATFFDTGAHTQAYPAVQKELVAQGHLIGTHSFDHRYPKAVPGGWTPAFVADQITRTQAAIHAATGETACFYRPPGGFLDNVPAAAKATRSTVVMWTIDSLDWQQPDTTTAAATAAIVANSTQVGDQQHPILLLHTAKASAEPDSKVSANRSNTIAALPAIIEWYRAHGYRFVRMDGKP